MPAVEKLNELSMRVNLTEQAKAGRYYHSAKKLVEIYRDVMWGLEYAYDEAHTACVDFGYKGINDALDFLEAGFADELSSIRLEDNARSMLFTHSLIKIVDKAMIALKDYPKCGEAYYEMIQRLYFLKYPYSEDDMLETMNISRSTFYRMKKNGISLLGVILWGYMLPGIIRDTKLTPL